MASKAIGLGDLIATTAAEIRKARDEAKKGDPVIKLEGCEIELKATVSAEAGGGIKVWILDLSAKGKAENASTIKLRFGPAGEKPAVFLVDRSSARESSDPIVPVRQATVVDDEVKK